MNWVLLTTSAELNSNTAQQFDTAVEACDLGYAMASQNLAHLTPVVGPLSAGDGGDASIGADANPLDVGVDGGFSGTRLVGGCSCRALPPVPSGGEAGLWTVAVLSLFMKRRNSLRVVGAIPHLW